MRVARMGFVTTKKGVKWVRVVVPDELQSVIGKKNLMASLETKDSRVATDRACPRTPRSSTRINSLLRAFPLRTLRCERWVIVRDHPGAPFA